MAFLNTSSAAPNRDFKTDDVTIEPGYNYKNWITITRQKLAVSAKPYNIYTYSKIYITYTPNHFN